MQRSFSCFLSVAVLIFSVQSVTFGQLEEGFDWLFDGKSLKGWEGNEDFFRVEQKAIVAGTLKKKIPNNEFLCTKQEYSDFELILEVKLRGEGKQCGNPVSLQENPERS